MGWQSKRSRHEKILKVTAAGYRLEHDFPEPGGLEIRARKGDITVARASFMVPHTGKYIAHDGWEAGTTEEHQRNGLYTAILVYAEIIVQRVVKDDHTGRSPVAQKVWDQQDRPFGNAEPAAEPNSEDGDDGQ
jgi:hypothetical protein